MENKRVKGLKSYRRFSFSSYLLFFQFVWNYIVNRWQGIFGFLWFFLDFLKWFFVDPWFWRWGSTPFFLLFLFPRSWTFSFMFSHCNLTKFSYNLKTRQSSKFWIKACFDFEKALPDVASFEHHNKRKIVNHTCFLMLLSFFSFQNKCFL